MYAWLDPSLGGVLDIFTRIFFLHFINVDYLHDERCKIWNNTTPAQCVAPIKFIVITIVVRGVDNDSN